MTIDGLDEQVRRPRMMIPGRAGGAVRAIGALAEVEVLVGSKKCPKRSPVVVGSMSGGFEEWTDRAAVDLKSAFSWFNRRTDGAWIGMTSRLPAARRPVGFVQSNNSAFHRAHYQSWWGSGKIWKDFYFACFYRILWELDAAFGSSDVQIQHPTVGVMQWPLSMQGILLDALNHLVETRPLRLERIHLGCPHDMTKSSIRQAAGLINAERPAERPPLLDPVAYESLDPTAVGCPGPDSLRLWRVEVRNPAR